MELNYKKLGFRCGIEVHQQLEGLKLFCSCPTLNSDKKPDICFARRLRAVAGETGKIDIAAAHEMEKGKEFIYIANTEDTCLVEFDSEPPHPLNQDALETTLQVALLLKANIIDEIEFMRKTVIDGSNTSGFQRTALIAIDGSLDTSQGKVKIESICLEEEAAQKIKEDKNSITYRLDRLGIPLIEIATDASIKSPQHAKEVAGLLGMILRSTEKVKRGLGTIRQDVNISVKEGVRTEIKGFQDLRTIPRVIENEVKRQLEAIKNGKNLEKTVRKAEPDFTTSFLRPLPGAARMYPETDIPNMQITPNLLKKIKIPELLTEKSFALEKKFKISDVHASEIIKENIDFETYANKYSKVKPNDIAKIIIDIPKDIKSRLKLDSSKLKTKDFEEVLSYLNENKINMDAVTEILSNKIQGKAINLLKYKKADTSQLEKDIAHIIKSKPNLSIGAYMGLIMAKYRGKADGKKVMILLNKLLKK